MGKTIKPTAEHDIITIASEFFEDIRKYGSNILESNKQKYPLLKQRLKMLEQISREKLDETTVCFFSSNANDPRDFYSYVDSEIYFPMDHGLITIASEFFEKIGRYGNEILESNKQKYPLLKQRLKMLEQIAHKKLDETKTLFFSCNIDNYPYFHSYFNEELDSPDKMLIRSLPSNREKLVPQNQKRAKKRTQDELPYPKLDPNNEKNRTRQQVKVRLPFNLIEAADKASKSKGLSRNAWIEGLIEKEVIVEDLHTL